MKKHFLLFASIILGLAISAGPAAGQAIVDSKLAQAMNSPGPYEVIVTFKEIGSVQRLSELGVPYLPLSVLPMAGAILTAGQIEQVRSWESVESIYLNDRLEYFNHDAGALTGAHYVQAVLGFTGRDKTIVVLDSGIDAAHPDLPLGPKVVQNVKILGDLGLTGTNAFVEGVINTDNTSGHGTHVAGTVAGTGAASAGDERDPYYYRGVAPSASLVGLGAGETLLILHALIGFDYAIANRDRYSIDVITNSWGNTSSRFDPNNPINRASYEAYRRGIVVTFAAGNEGPDNNTMSSYSISPWVIGVAAGTKSRALADFSSRGEAGVLYEHPDITAPGVSITSTRAPGTPVGALGPVVNPLHPEYTLYYHTISGTSMATPFVAGTVALLLEANPELSPDQIEEIITGTADPMAGYAQHEVGAGYINVRRAVELAMSTVGNRTQFLAGDVRWSSLATWSRAEESDPNLAFNGIWESVTDGDASGGQYLIGQPAGKGKKKQTQIPYMKAVFHGTTVKIHHPRRPSGGFADVLVDGISRGTMNFNAGQESWGHRFTVGDLENGEHTLEVRGISGEVYLDYLELDGKFFPANTRFVQETATFTGTLGPSVEGIPETRLIPFEIGPETIQLHANLSWTGGVDVDLYLLDPSGNTVASSASLDNPEEFVYAVSSPGEYTYRIVGYATVLADYTLVSTQTRAIVSSPSSASRTTGEEVRTPSSTPPVFALHQNYPNPFNPETTISYSIPFDGQVALRVYNILGKELATVVSEWKRAGAHAARFRATDVASGVYFLRLDVTSGAGETISTVNRMSIVR